MFNMKYQINLAYCQTHGAVVAGRDGGCDACKNDQKTVQRAGEALSGVPLSHDQATQRQTLPPVDVT